MRRLPALLAACLAAAAAVPARAQFGRNQVILKDFDWKVRSTEHFDIYYYEGSKPKVPEAAEVLETAFARVPRALDIPVRPPPWVSGKTAKEHEWKRRPFFLYANPNDFQQSNIAAAGDGTGGITEPYKDRFMVYNDGTKQWLEEVVTHEFVHVMQFDVLVSGFWRSGRILKSIVYPLWVMEGMPGYVTYGIESSIEETTIRDAATSGGLIPLPSLEHFGHLKPHQITLAYKEGAAALEFLASQYGARKVGEVLRLFESRFDTSQVLKELIGLDVFEFDRKFREYAVTKYRRVAKRERLAEPEAYGGALTRSRVNIPEFNTSPVFSPDGRTMYYVSTVSGYPPEIRERDLETGKSRRLPGADYVRVENMATGNFAFISRVLSLSSDGRRLAFAGTKNHQDALYLYDLAEQRLQKLELPGFMTAAQPAFSPDGRRLVFSGMKDTVTDLFLYELDSGRVARLTEDPQDDAMPGFTPDGRAVVYSREVKGAAPGHERRLFRVDLESRALAGLEESGGQARDPIVSEDGRKVLFVREDGEFSEVCELDLAARRALRLTRSIGGSYTPVYAGSEIAFSSLRRGSIHVYKGPRADFLSEELPSAGAPAPPARAYPPGLGDIRPSTASLALSAEGPYRFAFSTDLFLPAFFYSSLGGFFWTSYWQGSDLLGNHQAAALVSLHSDKDFFYQTQYAYLERRTQLIAGAAGIGQTQLIDGDTGDVVDAKVHEQFMGASYPFDRYHRLEGTLHTASERRNDLTAGTLKISEGRFARAALVRDTARGRYLSANQGDRLSLAYLQGADVLGGNKSYSAATLEGHKFFPVGGMSALAFRAVGVRAFGPDVPQYILGGIGGARGVARSVSQDYGNRLALLNAEWRFPIFPDLNYHMWYFFPDFYFKAIFGTLFSDTGIAWTSRQSSGATRWGEVKNSVGLGLRFYTFVLEEFQLIISMDYARRTNDGAGIFYVYLGQVF